MIGGMFFARRWNPLQKHRIRKHLRKPLDVSSYAPIDRSEEEARLRNFIEHPPSGPIVMVGPEGCGKSILLKKVLSGRMMSYFLDLRANTIMSGDELVIAFIQQSGYLLPSTDPLSAYFLKADKKNKINPQELNTALDLMQQVLATEKRKGWKSGIPVICIDHVHSLGSSYDLDPKKPKITDDANFLRLVDWVITVSDKKLAHVVFTTSTAFAALDLDRNTSFRDRRILFYVHYPPPEQVKSFLAAYVNPELPEDKRLSGTDIDTMVDCIGGHLRDLETIIQGLHRNDSFLKVLRSLVTENVRFLVDYMEQLLDGFYKDVKEGKGKKEACESYLRFLDLMVQLRDHDFIDRRTLTTTIFKDKPKELDTYLVAGIIRYVVTDGHAIALQSRPLKHLTSHDTYSPVLSASVDGASPLSSPISSPSASPFNPESLDAIRAHESSLKSSWDKLLNTNSTSATAAANVDNINTTSTATSNNSNSNATVNPPTTAPTAGDPLTKTSNRVEGISLAQHRTTTAIASPPSADPPALPPSTAQHSDGPSVFQTLQKPVKDEAVDAKFTSTRPDQKGGSAPTSSHASPPPTSPSSTSTSGGAVSETAPLLLSKPNSGPEQTPLPKQAQQDAGSKCGGGGASTGVTAPFSLEKTAVATSSLLTDSSLTSSSLRTTGDVPSNFQLICEQVFIAAGSPRMRTSFAIVLSDPHLALQQAEVNKYLKKQKLKDKERELEEKRKISSDELSKLSGKVDNMVQHSAQWRDVIGQGNFSQKVQQALTAESQATDTLKNVEAELGKIRAELDDL